MATPRKRSSGFTKPAEELTEEAQISEFLDEVATEMFETISQKEKEEEEKVTESPAPTPAPPVVESITPTEDLGPRFAEKVEESPQVVTPGVPTPPVEAVIHPPKRHPRNIPRFSRTRKA